MGAVLLSERAQRTVLSTSVMFLIAGFVIGQGGAQWVPLTLDDPLIEGFAELALFTVLFVDGAQISARDLFEARRLPGRALLLGMPLTMAGIALAAYAVSSASSRHRHVDHCAFLYGRGRCAHLHQG